MKRLVFLAIMIALTTACGRMSKSESEQNSESTSYRYGMLVKIKSGFFGGYGCAMIREYEDSVFCKIMLTPDGLRVSEEWQTNQFFKKNNVEEIVFEENKE